MTTKCAKKTASKLLQSTQFAGEDAADARALRYTQFAAVLEDFPRPRDRAALLAVLRWLCMNTTVARKLRRPGSYSTRFRARDLDQLLHADAVVMARSTLDAAMDLVDPEWTGTHAQATPGHAAVARSRTKARNTRTP